MNIGEQMTGSRSCLRKARQVTGEIGMVSAPAVDDRMLDPIIDRPAPADHPLNAGVRRRSVGMVRVEDAAEVDD
jgi:hypothetical protein